MKLLLKVYPVFFGVIRKDGHNYKSLVSYFSIFPAEKPDEKREVVLHGHPFSIGLALRAQFLHLAQRLRHFLFVLRPEFRSDRGDGNDGVPVSPLLDGLPESSVRAQR